MSRCSALFCCVLFSALTTYLAYAMTAEQKQKIHDHFVELAGQCIQEFPITEDDINNFKAKKMGTSEHAACFIACVMRKSGVMDDKGMLQKENALELAKKVFEDPEEIKNMEDYLHVCGKVNDATVGDGDKGCERASLAFTCMNENASKFGFDV
ncbi:PBP/GOBP family domain-containing protein [Phthorimaea operculella]|nr:PBP/GOBP family domain-containing protein [Phthorimaea operculella]